MEDNINNKDNISSEGNTNSNNKVSSKDNNNGLKIMAIVFAVIAVIAIIIAVVAVKGIKKLTQNNHKTVTEQTDNLEGDSEEGTNAEAKSSDIADGNDGASDKDKNDSSESARFVINPEDLGIKPASEDEEEENVHRPRYKDEMTEKELFKEFAGVYSFSSGAGGWGTELEIREDGSFIVQYHDSDMGDMGDDYPNGTCYAGDGEGKFELVRRIDEYTYRVKCNLNTTTPTGTEEIIDGIKYVYTDVYGMDGDGVFEMILPGKAVNELTEELISWLGFGWMPFYPAYTTDMVIRNTSSDSGFVQYNYEDDEQTVEIPKTETVDINNIYGEYIGLDGSVMYIERDYDLIDDEKVFAFANFYWDKHREYEYRKNYALKKLGNQYVANEYYEFDGNYTLSEYNPVVFVFTDGDSYSFDVYDMNGTYYNSYIKGTDY